MMNRALLQRQMFANGGRVIPDDAKGLQALAAERPDVVKKMGFKPMQEGGLAGLMQQQDMAAMPMGSPPMDQPPMAAQSGVDPNVLASTLSNVAEDTGDLEQASDFQSMMNQFSGEDKSEEERRDDLASIVGPEDAAQTPDSVLALVTPIVQISMAEEGIAPMARDAMDTPVEGDMAGGIMSMTGAGNEPPENFRYGGEVRRRGDEDPVLKFSKGMGVPGTITPMTDYQQKVGETATALLPTFQQFLPTTDPETQKRRLQSDIFFDIANTALAFSAPMKGERKGLSPAERLALAAQTTQLLPKIQARTSKAAEDIKKQELAQKSGALQAAIGLEQARLKQVGAERGQLISGAFTLADTAKKLAFKKAEGISSRAHEEQMQKNKFALQTTLDEINKKLDFGYDTKLAEQKKEIETALKKVQEGIDINKINIQHEDNIEKINLEITGRKDVAKVNNIAALERLKLNITSREGIAEANRQMDRVIANEKNNTSLLINENNIAQKNLRLKFDKVREANLVADRNAKNQQAIAELDLKKVTEARKTLEGLKDFELKKAQGERDEKKLQLIEKELNEVKIAETQIKKFAAENKAENDKEVLAYKKDALSKLNQYRTRSLDLKEELNQITRTNNVVSGQLKKEELALKKHNAQLNMFGTGTRGRIMNILSDPRRYEAYGKGENDNVLEQALLDYIAPETTIQGSRIERKIPQHIQDALKSRLQLGLPIPKDIPLSKLNLTETEKKSFEPIPQDVGTAALEKIVDPNVDLTDATGFISTVKTGIRFLVGQASEIGITQGDIFKETSAGRKMLNALANATERFIREATNDRLDVQSLARLQKELVRPSGLRTDADALSQLRVTQSVMKKTRDELQEIINNPQKYKDTSIDKARKGLTLTNGLIQEYQTAINSYERFGGFRKGGDIETDRRILKNIIKRSGG